MRSQLILACFLFAAFSTAAPPEGAWSGSLGSRKIAACFDGSASTYYYVSKGIDIELTELENGVWEEVAWDKSLGSRPSTGTWYLEDPEGKHLRGKWVSPGGNRTIPIALTLAGTLSTDSTCPLPGYKAPRIDAVRRTASKETTASGLRLRAFKALHGAVVGLELLEDAPALRPLKQAIEERDREMIEGYFECMSQPAIHGNYTTTLELTFASEHWVGLVEKFGQDCGYPHPDWGVRAWTLDRSSGKPVDIAKWLNASLNEIGRKYFRWTKPELASAQDCSDAVNEYASFVAWPTTKGFVFYPQLFHATAVCSRAYDVPYSKLMGELTPAGMAAIDEISKSASPVSRHVVAPATAPVTSRTGRAGSAQVRSGDTHEKAPAGGRRAASDSARSP